MLHDGSKPPQGEHSCVWPSQRVALSGPGPTNTSSALHRSYNCLLKSSNGLLHCADSDCSRLLCQNGPPALRVLLTAFLLQPPASCGTFSVVSGKGLVLRKGTVRTHRLSLLMLFGPTTWTCFRLLVLLRAKAHVLPILQTYTLQILLTACVFQP